MSNHRYYAYIVKWNDSAVTRGWRSIDDPALGVSGITTIGFVVKQTKKIVVVTTSMSECGNVMDAMAIPKVSIFSMKRLKFYIESKS